MDNDVSFDDFFPEDEVPGAAGPLRIVNLSSSATLLAMFTKQGVKIFTHYREDIHSFHCNDAREGKCLACTIGIEKDEKLLLPVVDLEAQEVRLLRISSSRKPHSLYAGVKPYLSEAAGHPQVISVTFSSQRHIVQPVPTSHHVALGEVAVKDFEERRRLGHVSLADCVASYTNRELADVPTIQRRAVAYGIDLQSWLT